MASIDVGYYNLQSWSESCDIAVATQVSLPVCSDFFCLRRGPSLLQIGVHLASKVPYEISRSTGLFGFHGEDPRPEVAEKLPLEFQLADGGAVGVIVESVDLNADMAAYMVAINRTTIRPSTGVGLKGWLVHLDRAKRINQLEVKKCLVFYRPDERQGYVGIVADKQPQPKTQIISGMESLANIVHFHFREGFVEVYAPDRKSRWGRISGFSSGVGEVYVSALRYPSGEWKFDRPNRNELGLYVFGEVLYEKQRTPKLPGDVLLCSDGTILCSYYFSRNIQLDKMKKAGNRNNLPEEWVDGYCFSRFYPRDSTLVPSEVVESFNRDMPEYYRTKLLSQTEVLK